MSLDTFQSLIQVFLMDKNDRKDNVAFESCYITRSFLYEEVKLSEKDFIKNADQPLDEPMCEAEVDQIINNVQALEKVSDSMPPTCNATILLSSSDIKVARTGQENGENAKQTEGHELLDRLDALLYQHSLIRVEIPGDGNCLLKAISKCLDDIFKRRAPSVSHHLNNLDIFTQEGNACHVKLRKQTINHMISNKKAYISFISLKSSKRFVTEAEKYYNDGQFDGDIGDIIPKAMADFLRMSILLFITNPHQQTMSILPTSSYHRTQLALKWAYNSQGKGNLMLEAQE